MEKLLIGVIVKPQGIRGEVKVKNYTDGFSSISGLKQVFIGDVCYQVLKMRYDKDVFMLLKGISDRNAAELLRGAEVYALKEDIYKPEGAQFICDVIGCSVYLSDGTYAGVITDILSARTDIYYLDAPDGKCIFPLLRSLNAQFDIENKRVTLDKEVFLQEMRYEN